LRYYNEIGLLKPQKIDALTGYRLYTFDQLPRLNRILALKELSLSLDQIGKLLDEELTAEQLRGILRFKQVEIKGRMEEEEQKLDRVEARLKMIEQEDEMPEYDVVIKQVDPVLVASVRNVIPTYPEQGHLWNQLEIFLNHNKISPTGPCFTIYYTDEPNVDTEVCEPVDDQIPQDSLVKSRQVPGVELMATVIQRSLSG
jgi:DNA-binding transcriptional MerR regulator